MGFLGGVCVCVCFFLKQFLLQRNTLFYKKVLPFSSNSKAVRQQHEARTLWSLTVGLGKEMSHSALGLHPITLIRAQHRTQAPHLISTPWPFHAIPAVLRLCPDNLEARAGITPYPPVLLALYFASSHQKEGHFSKQSFRDAGPASSASQKCEQERGGSRTVLGLPPRS